jgi:hypothetical protein
MIQTPQSRPIGLPVSILVAHEQEQAKALADAPPTVANAESTQWGPTPQFLDQFLHQKLWREGLRVTHVFDLLIPGDLAKWNEQQAKMYPAGSPTQILLSEPTITKVEDKLILVAYFQQIEYAQVIPT